MTVSHGIKRADILQLGGAIRSLIEPVVTKAREEGVPVWLEAINEHARDVYAYFGFEIVEQITIGQGVIDSDGWIHPEGNGVYVWAMAAGL